MLTMKSAKAGKRKVNKSKYQDFYFEIKYALGCPCEMVLEFPMYNMT
jgi:hypothetical protein